MNTPDYATKEFLTKFLTEDQTVLKLASNSGRVFIQVGGSVVNSFLVASFQTYDAVIYYGTLDEEEEKKFEGLNTYCIQTKFYAKVLLGDSSSIATISEYFVVCVLEERLIEDFKEIADSCEFYVSEEFLERYPTKKIFSSSISLFFQEKYYLIVENDKIDNPFLQALFDLETADNEDLLFIKTQELSESFTSIPEDPADIINKLNLDFLALDRREILIDWCRFFAFFIQRTISNENAELSSLLYLLLKEKLFTWTTYFVVFRTLLSSFIISLLIEAIYTFNFTNILNIPFNFVFLKTKLLTPEQKNLISDSFTQFLVRNKRVKALCCMLDEKPGSLEEEIGAISTLIPDLLFIHPSTYSFAGKTLLGGLITISADCFPIMEDTISKAAFLIVLRHELCHKKLVLSGLDGKFSRRTPPFEDDDGQEAGTALDRLIYGAFDYGNVFSVKGLTLEIAEKVLAGDILETRELSQIFVRPSMQQIRSIRVCGSESPLRFLCTGRSTFFK